MVDSFSLTIETNADEVADLLADVGSKIVEQAKVAAINKAMTQERTQVRRYIAGRTGIPNKVLNRRIRIRRATRKRPIANLFVGTYNVLAFKDLGGKDLRVGVSYKGSGGRVKNTSGFKATMPSGHEGLFVRKGKARLKIKEISANFVPEARAAIAKSRITLPARFKKIFNQQFNFRVGREIDKRRLRP